VIFLRLIFVLTVLLINQSPVAAETSVDTKTGLLSPETTVPDRDIQYSGKAMLPQWKIDWDQARALCRKGKIGQALVQYELLLQEKSTVDEARWEYASLLEQEKRWQQAGKELDTLLVHNPGNRKYLLARARVSLQEGLTEQAIKQYGQLYEGCPAGADALEALTGLITALDRQGNKAAQLPLLELLLLRKPGDLFLLKRTGALALALGQAEKTRDLLIKPLREHPDDADLLRLLAHAEERLNNPGHAACFYQELVAVLPGDVQANSWLSKYYQTLGNLEMALVHVRRQLKFDPGNADLILQAARLYDRMGRFGKALDYFYLYLELVPGNQNAIKQRNHTRKKLAFNLIALVENRKVEQLWKDLQEMTRDREGVFQQLADWFRKQGKQVELTEVLLLLYRQHPDNQKIYQELATLLEKQGRYNELEKL
jgi:tetratricopeptide (TPR) repeat protein